MLMEQTKIGNIQIHGPTKLMENGLMVVLIVPMDLQISQNQNVLTRFVMVLPSQDVWIMV